jgi:hypothetical protein
MNDVSLSFLSTNEISSFDRAALTQDTFSLVVDFRQQNVCVTFRQQPRACDDDIKNQKNEVHPVPSLRLSHKSWRSCTTFKFPKKSKFTMKTQTFALLATIVAPVGAFVFKAPSTASKTALKETMEAYEQQMRAMAAGAPPMSGVASGNTATMNSAAAVQYNTVALDNFKLGQRWRKKTKQLATLGPASSTFEMIEKLFVNGADVFRLNFSHGEHAQKKELLDIIRQVEAKYEHPIAVLGDLQGPKLRVGQFANPDGEILQTGQAFRFDLDATLGTNQRVLLPHPEIIEASDVGHVLLVDDGKVKLQVTGTGPGYIDCTVGTYKNCATHGIVFTG